MQHALMVMSGGYLATPDHGDRYLALLRAFTEMFLQVISHVMNSSLNNGRTFIGEWTTTTRGALLCNITKLSEMAFYV